MQLRVAWSDEELLEAFDVIGHSSFEEFVNSVMERHQKKQAVRTPLERVLRESGVTQTALAAQFGVSQPTVSRWVSGAQPLTADQADYLARFLEVETAEFDSMVGGVHRDHKIVLDRNTYFGNVVAIATYEVMGPTPEGVAEFLGVPKSVFAQWCQGDGFPDEATAEAFVRRFLPGLVEQFGLS